MKRFLFLLLFLIPANLLNGQSRSTQVYDNGLVVSAEVYASEVGKQILQQGGNAVDAAVAVQFALAVTLPRAGNIGGGGFMVIQLADGTSTTLDFREKAPQRASRNMYVRNGEFDPELSWEGILASGVPGTVDGMVTALERYGRMPLELVIQPAIDLAQNGYYLSYTQAQELNSRFNTFSKYEGSKKYFTKEDGTPFKEGDLFIQKDLSEVLEQIARYGRDGFYSGSVADAIVQQMREMGGLISYSDLRNYRSKWREPVKARFQDYELSIMPPPSSGSIAVYQILDMMDDYALSELGHNSADYVHLMAESMRRAFADRSFYLGDPDFTDIPKQDLLDPKYNHARMIDFSMDTITHSSALSHGEFSNNYESDETTHFSIIDRDGNAVAVTTTLNGSFGSKVAVNGAGFLLNNEMDDFSAQPGEPNAYGLIGGEANSIEPGKRMLSSMTPTIVTKDGKVRMILGAAGGPRIITATLQNFLNIAVFGMNAQEAIAANRVHHQWLPDILFYENYGLSPDTIRLLEQKGHQLRTMSIARGHLIYINPDGKKSSGVDPRGDGHAAGY
ncbi:MAG: gamma-glutamyltransferase [Balneola sp.]|nr:gamma-glutamyltransferase [Balneola sp.]